MNINHVWAIPKVFISTAGFSEQRGLASDVVPCILNNPLIEIVVHFGEHLGALAAPARRDATSNACASGVFADIV